MKKNIIALLLAVFILSGCKILGQSPNNEITDTIRWFNATYAILTKINNRDINIIGGDKPSLINRAVELSTLEEYWGITNREEAEEMIVWLLEGGHNEQFIDDYFYYELYKYTKEDLLEDLQRQSRGVLHYFLNLHETYERFGEKAIIGWDLSRANSLLGWYYIAGFYDYEESLDGMLMVSKIIQETFDSFDEFVDSYMRGYLWWSEDDPSGISSDYQARLKIYEDLINMEDSPFNLDFDMNFEVTWR